MLKRVKTGAKNGLKTPGYHLKEKKIGGRLKLKNPKFPKGGLSSRKRLEL